MEEVAFKKDLLNLIYLCEYFGLLEVANYWESVLKINNWQKNRISNLIVEKLFGTLVGKKIAVLGFSFKANTNDTRESPAIEICMNLLEEGASLSIHDPKVSCLQIKREFHNYLNKKNLNYDIENWEFAKSIDIAIKDSNAVLILTEWEEYKILDWEKKAKLMLPPAWIFDSRLVTQEKNLSITNLNYWRIGNENNINNIN